MKPRYFLSEAVPVQHLVMIWPDGSATLATRVGSSAVWGPPVELHEEDGQGNRLYELAASTE